MEHNAEINYDKTLAHWWKERGQRHVVSDNVPEGVREAKRLFDAARDMNNECSCRLLTHERAMRLAIKSADDSTDHFNSIMHLFQMHQKLKLDSEIAERQFKSGWAETLLVRGERGLHTWE